MPHIPASLRDRVIERAANRCEYCGLSQAGQVATFHIDHIVPVIADGKTEEDNLALACVSCSLRKGSRQTVQDPETREDVKVFNPRRQSWPEHFRWEDVRVVGLTPTGRAMVTALNLNRPVVIAMGASTTWGRG